MTSRETTTTQNVFEVDATDLTEGEDFLVPKDLGDTEATQHRPAQPTKGHRAWAVKLVASEDSDADVDVEAAVTTADDTTFDEYGKGGTSDTALSGTTAPESVGLVLSDEAAVTGINAVLNAQTAPTAGTYKVVIETRRF